MIEMRFHGRGGQGTVKGCQTLVKAFVEDGNYAQFIPAFGVERKGSPVYGYLRQDEKEIRFNCEVYNPDIIVVSDYTLLDSINVFEGAKENALLILNFPHGPADIKVPEGIRVATVNARDIALETIKTDIPNTAMLGAIARMMDTVNHDILRSRVVKAFGEANGLAFDGGYEQVQF